MKHKIETSFVTGTVDPTELSEWDEVHPSKLIGLGGYIPAWFMEYCVEEGDRPIVEYMGEMYRFGMHEMTGGTVDGDLIYQYPGDPQLHPAFHLKAKHNGAEMVCYQHAIFAFRDKPEDEWYVTRMD